MRRIIVASVIALSSQVATVFSSPAQETIDAETAHQAVLQPAPTETPLTLSTIEATPPVVTVMVTPDPAIEPVIPSPPILPLATHPESKDLNPAGPILRTASALPISVSIATKSRPAYRAKIAKAKRIHNAFLPRTRRHQIALLAFPTTRNAPAILFEDNDIDFGVDALDLHVFYGRPKLVTDAESDDLNDDGEISDSIKFRLLLARMRALEAHAIAQAVRTPKVFPPLSNLQEEWPQRGTSTR